VIKIRVRPLDIFVSFYIGVIIFLICENIIIELIRTVYNFIYQGTDCIIIGSFVPDLFYATLNAHREAKLSELVFGYAGICGFLLALYSYFKEKVKRKSPCYRIKSSAQIDSRLSINDKLKILYNDTQIENLTLSKIILWNSGGDTISSADVIREKPLRIEIDSNYTILECSVRDINNRGNGFQVIYSPDGKKVDIAFEFFDCMEGAIFTLLHTGASKNLKLSGSIRSVKSMKDVDKQNITVKKIIQAYERLYPILVLIISMSIFVPHYFADIYILCKVILLLTGLVATLFFGLGYALSCINRRKILHTVLLKD